MKHRILQGRLAMLRPALILALSFSATPALPETTFQIPDYLPMAVGNSWTYTLHHYDEGPYPNNRFPYTEWQDSASKEVTLSILRAELIDGDTYYVFSDVPEGWPPAPAHSVAGKKLRWDGSNLTEHDGTSPISILRFRVGPTSRDSFARYEYTVSASDAGGDTEATLLVTLADNAILTSSFAFEGALARPLSGRVVEFTTGYGMTVAHDALIPEGTSYPPTIETILRPVRATLLVEDPPAPDGSGTSSSETTHSHRVLEFSDVVSAAYGHQPFPQGTKSSTSSPSWGQVKERNSE